MMKSNNSLKEKLKKCVNVDFDEELGGKDLLRRLFNNEVDICYYVSNYDETNSCRSGKEYAIFKFYDYYFKMEIIFGSCSGCDEWYELKDKEFIEHINELIDDLTFSKIKITCV